MSYKLIRRLPLPTVLQDMILEYMCSHRREWSRYWLKLSLKHIYILRNERYQPFPLNFHSAIHSVNIYIGAVDYDVIYNKQYMIDELQTKYNMEKRPPIFDEEQTIDIPTFRY